ncbi:MAG: endonuclease NucS [Candidatus Bathyarchaeia archaeon]
MPYHGTKLFDAPGNDECAKLIGDATRSRSLVILIGNCRVDYEGRASSTLTPGERFLIIKPDGSVLIHRPTGYEPVNWQPPGSLIASDVTSDGELRITAKRLTPRETLTVYFNEVYCASLSSLEDAGEFNLYVTESDMKKAVLLRPDLVEANFTPRSSERPIGDSGFMDVVGEDGDGNFLVVELKRTPAGPDAVLQLTRYVNALRTKVNKKVRGVILAPAIRREAQPLLAGAGLEFKAVSLRRCSEILRVAKDRKVTDFVET